MTKSKANALLCETPVFNRLLKNAGLDAVSRRWFTFGTAAAGRVTMRGTGKASGSLFSYVDLEERIPEGHSLRKIRQIVNDALASLDTEFDVLYTDFSRPPSRRSA